MQNDRAKIAKWDNFKFFLILTVVIGHFFARVDDSHMAKSTILWIYSFHMPGFVFVSGLFSKRTIHEKRFDKIFSYLIMFFVTKYILFFLRLLRGAEPSLSYSKINDVSWYAFAIFVFYLLTIFLKQYHRGYVMTAAVVFACLTGYAQDVGTFLSLSRIAAFYPFFLLGFYLNPADLIKLTDRWYCKILAVFIILQTAVISFAKIDEVYWLLKICKGKYSYADLAYGNKWGGLMRLAWYLIAMLLVLSLLAVTPSFRSIITTWGSRTMQVYVLHYVPMLLFFDWFGGDVCLQNLQPSQSLAVIFLTACLVTCVLSCRPVQIVMGRIIYPKKAIPGKQCG